jgi:hypothetical protein
MGCCLSSPAVEAAANPNGQPATSVVIQEKVKPPAEQPGYALPSRIDHLLICIYQCSASPLMCPATNELRFWLVSSVLPGTCYETRGMCNLAHFALGHLGPRTLGTPESTISLPCPYWVHRAPVVAPVKVGKAEVKSGKRPDVVSSAKFNDSAGTSGASDLGNASFTEFKGMLLYQSGPFGCFLSFMSTTYNPGHVCVVSIAVAL